jgi:hypothetical protein
MGPSGISPVIPASGSVSESSPPGNSGLSTDRHTRFSKQGCNGHADITALASKPSGNGIARPT